MALPLVYLQNTFDGGMNQQCDGSRVAANEYPLLINGRHRNDIIEQINSPVDQTPLGVTNIQGCYAAGDYSVLFAAGKAYYKDESIVGSTYVQITGFEMSPVAPILYACAIPASTINSQRKLVSGTGDITKGVVLLGVGASSPQALLVQDGINQPWIILSDGTARVTQVYNNWTQDNREYVPVGLQMLYQDGILYIVSSDGSQVYRSVTGRPLDFMVIIDSNGDKLPSESDGGAASISFKVDFAPITTIAPLSSPDGSFYVSTARTSYAVTPDFTQTVYGEPQFVSTFLFTTGAVNNFSVCDILGDTAIVDYSGIRSFNSVSQYRFEGKNSPFSNKVSGLLTNIKQTNSACITHDNYALFYVTTVFGSGVLVFDTTTKCWSSLDLLSPLTAEAVLMFCEVKTKTSRKLLCITRSHVFELYPSVGTPEFVGYYTPEFNSNDPQICQKSTNLKLGFVNVTTSGTVYARLVEDGKIGALKTTRVRNVSLTDPVRAVPPIKHGSKDSARNVVVPLLDVAKSCWKCGLYIRWSFKGALNTVKLFSNPEPAMNSLEEQASGGQSLMIDAISSPRVLTSGSIIDIFGDGFNCVARIQINGLIVPRYAILDDRWIRLTLPVDWQYGTLALTVAVTTCDGSSYTWGLAGAVSDLPVDNTDGGVWLNPGDVIIDTNNPDDTIDNVDDVLKGFPHIVTDPPPMQCSITTTFDPNSLNVVDMSGKGIPDAYILDLTNLLPADSNINFAGLYFNKNANGSFTFISPLISSADGYSMNKDVDTALALIGNSYNTESGLVPFVFGGLSFCVSFSGSVNPGSGDACHSAYSQSLTYGGSGFQGTCTFTLTLKTAFGVDYYESDNIVWTPPSGPTVTSGPLRVDKVNGSWRGVYSSGDSGGNKILVGTGNSTVSCQMPGEIPTYNTDDPHAVLQATFFPA